MLQGSSLLLLPTAGSQLRAESVDDLSHQREVLQASIAVCACLQGRSKSRWGVDLGVKAEPAVTPTGKPEVSKGPGAQQAAVGLGTLAAEAEPSAAAKVKPEAGAGAANSSAAAAPSATAEGVKAAKDFAAELSEQLRAKMAASAQASPAGNAGAGSKAAGAAAQNGVDMKHIGSPRESGSRGARGSPSAGRSPARPGGSRAAAREGAGRSPARRAGSGAAAARDDGPRSRRSPPKDSRRSPARDLHRKRGRSRTASRSPAGRPSSRGDAAAGGKAGKPKAAEGPSIKSPVKGSDGGRTPVAKRRSLSPIRGSDARRQRRSAPKRSSPSPGRGGAGGGSRRRQSEREEGEMSAGPPSQSPPRADKRRRWVSALHEGRATSGRCSAARSGQEGLVHQACIMDAGRLSLCSGVHASCSFRVQGPQPMCPDSCSASCRSLDLTACVPCTGSVDLQHTGPWLPSAIGTTVLAAASAAGTIPGVRIETGACRPLNAPAGCACIS